MHVRDALITTEGAFLARGAVSFEPDPAGYFTCPPHDYLILDLAGPLNGRIIPATAIRDPVTGYMRAQPVGGRFSLPAVLDRELRRALMRHVSPPAVVRADHEQGSLESVADPLGGGRSQKLGRCVLETAVAPAWVEFTVTAELRAALPDPDWDRSTRNYWGVQGPLARLSASFRVDAPTSWIAYGAAAIPSSPVAESDARPFDGHEGVFLERSVCPYAGSLLAGSPGGQTWRVFTGLTGPRSESEEVLWLSPLARLDRRENGLFEALDRRGNWGLRCSAFTLERVVQLLKPGETLELLARGGAAAGVHSGYREDTRSWDCRSIALTAAAAPSGISVSLEPRFEPAGPSLPEFLTRIAFTVPRETLLLRYPRDHARLYGPL